METFTQTRVRMTPIQAAGYLGMALGTLYNKTSRREVPHHKLGRLVFLRDELDAYLAGGRVKTVEELRAEADEIMSKRSKIRRAV